MAMCNQIWHGFYGINSGTIELILIHLDVNLLLLVCGSDLCKAELQLSFKASFCGTPLLSAAPLNLLTAFLHQNYP
jgi:hypothetical protein